MNKTCDTMEMPDMRAELMNVPADAYKTLKKIDINAFTVKTKNHNPYAGYGERT